MGERKREDYRFTTYQDARRVRIVDGRGLETKILLVSPVKRENSKNERGRQKAAHTGMEKTQKINCVR